MRMSRAICQCLPLTKGAPGTWRFLWTHKDKAEPAYIPCQGDVTHTSLIKTEIVGLRTNVILQAVGIQPDLTYARQCRPDTTSTRGF